MRQGIIVGWNEGS